MGWEVDGIEKLPREIRAAFPANGRATGLPQGTALAPVLANLMLGGIDREANKKGFALVRYADDVILLAESREQALSQFAWYREKLAELGLSVYDPSENNKKARSFEDIGKEGIEYLGCFLKEHGKCLTVRPTDAKLDCIKNNLYAIFTKRGRATFPQRIIDASQMAHAWLASYRNVAGTKRLEKRLSDHFASSIEGLLKKKGLLAEDRSLSLEHRAFLGLQLRFRRQSKPSRAFKRKRSRR